MSVRSNGWKVSLVALVGLGVSACSGDTREFLGLEKNAPDEFAVYSRAPLSLPPDFALRPPEPGRTRPQAEDPSAVAQRALTGRQLQVQRDERAQEYNDMTPGLRAMLEETGALDADPSIRATVDRETSIYIDESDTFTKDLLFWKSDQPFGEVVDPAAETQRIRENQATGRPITEGETPRIEREDGAILEGIFN